MSHLRSLVIFCASWGILLGSLPVFAEAHSPNDAAVTIGGRTVIFPAPEGFVRSDGIDANWDAATTAMLPATNRQLITFSTPEDVAAIRDQTFCENLRGFNCQVVRSLESQEIGERTFMQIRAGARAEIEQLMSQLDEQMQRFVQEGNQQLSDQFGAEAALAISDSAALGFFEESPTSLGFTMAMNVRAQQDDGTEPERRVVAAIMVPVNGRLINLYAASAYRGEEDRVWVERAVAAWRDAIVNANPRVAGPVGGFNDRAAYLSGVIGGLIGGFVGGFMWLFRKKGKKVSIT